MLVRSPQHAWRAVAGATRPVRFTLAAVFVLDVFTTVIVAAYGNSYLVKTLDAPPSYPAFALATYGFVKLLTAPVGGWLTDRARPALSVGLSGGLQVLGVAVMLTERTPEAFVAGTGVLAAGATLLWLLVFESLSVNLAAEERGAATASLGIVSVVSIGFGFGVAAVLAETTPELVFTLSLGLGAASAALLLPAFPRGDTAAIEGAEEPRVPDGWRPARPEAMAIAIAFGHFLCVNATIAALSPLALGRLDLTLLQLGVVLTPAAAAGGLAMLVLGRRSREGRRMREMAPLYALGAAGLVLAAFVSDWAPFAVAMVAAGVTLGGTMPLLNASRIDLSAQTAAPGRILGRLLFAEGLGSVVGPVATGLVITASDERAGAVAAGVAFAVLAVLTAYTARTVRL
ncbi:MAG: MFS transporter [Dehalococcoidia bacterium]